MSGAAATLSVVALAAVAYVFIRRWRRSDKSGRIPFIVGAVLIVVSLATGIWLLPVRGASTSEPRSVGVVPPELPRVTGTSGDGSGKRGFSLSTAVFAGDCSDDVRVVMVANGSAEYWRDRGTRFPRLTAFHLALPGTGPHDIKMGLSDRAIDSQLPMHAAAYDSEQLTALPTRILHDVDTTVVSATVRDWRKHLRAVVVSFRADWLMPRGLQSCYLTLPAITGGLSVLAAQIAKGQAHRDIRNAPGTDRLLIRSRRMGLAARYDRRLETTFGTTTVVARKGEISSDASLPGPDLTSEGHPTWVCETTPPSSRRSSGTDARSTPDVLLGPQGGVFSQRYLKQALGSDCSSVAVLVENGASTVRDFVILVLGAFISLGAAIVVEAGLDRSTGGVPVPQDVASGRKSPARSTWQPSQPRRRRGRSRRKK